MTPTQCTITHGEHEGAFLGSIGGFDYYRCRYCGTDYREENGEPLDGYEPEAEDYTDDLDTVSLFARHGTL